MVLHFNTRVWLSINTFLVLLAIMLIDPINYSKSIFIDLIHISYFLVIAIEVFAILSLMGLKSKVKLIEKAEQKISVKMKLSIFIENLCLLLVAMSINLNFGWYIIATYLSVRFFYVLFNLIKSDSKKE